MSNRTFMRLVLVIILLPYIGLVVGGMTGVVLFVAGVLGGPILFLYSLFGLLR